MSWVAVEYESRLGEVLIVLSYGVLRCCMEERMKRCLMGEKEGFIHRPSTEELCKQSRESAPACSRCYMIMLEPTSIFCKLSNHCLRECSRGATILPKCSSILVRAKYHVTECFSTHIGCLCSSGPLKRSKQRRTRFIDDPQSFPIGLRGDRRNAYPPYWSVFSPFIKQQRESCFSWSLVCAA